MPTFFLLKGGEQGAEATVEVLQYNFEKESAEGVCTTSPPAPFLFQR